MDDIMKNIFLAGLLSSVALVPTALIAEGKISLPTSDENVSLERYDSYIDKLSKDINLRLGQLDATGSPSKLQNPSLEEKKDTLQGVSEIQEEILLLEQKLKQAQLARQVYEEIYSDKTPEYIAEIEDLKSKLEISENAFRESEISVSELTLEVSQFSENNKDMIREIDFLRDENATLTAQLREVLVSSASAPGGGLQADALLAALGSSNSLKSRSFPEVEAITIVGSRKIVSIVLPDGNFIDARVGDEVGNGFVITRIEQRAAYFDDNGNERKLPFYKSQTGSIISSPEELNNNSFDQNSFGGNGFNDNAFNNVANGANF
jgi:hypothetical protein